MYLFGSDEEDSVRFYLIFFKVNDMCATSFVYPIYGIKEMSVRERNFDVSVIHYSTFDFEIILFDRGVPDL